MTSTGRPVRHRRCRPGRGQGRADAARGGLRRAGSCWSATKTDRPYERPPLSKDYLQGKTGRDDDLRASPDWYADHDIDLLLRHGGHRDRPGPRTR